MGQLRTDGERRRALVIAYHFPPQGGGGVQRSVKFVRYLPEYGYEPVVVTGPDGGEGRWTPRDESLVGEHGCTDEVHRARGAPPEGSRARGRASRWLGIDSAFGAWWKRAGLEAARRAGGADVVYASMSPWESGDVAARIARELRCPWVADLRDPWALDEMTIYPSRAHRMLAERRMQSTLRSAAAIVMNVPEARRALLARFPRLADRPVLTIPNGYDAADFAAAPSQVAAGPFRIVHTGFLHTAEGERERRAAKLRRALGGAAAGVDILARSHVSLLDAVARVRAAEPRLAERLEVHLAGMMTEADRAAAASPAVREHGYLAHADSIALMRSADLLFLPMHGLTPGRRARIAPGKTYEYLAARRPILAAVPDGDARDLLAQAPHVHLCRPGDAAAMARIIAAELRRPERRPPGPPPPPAFERRHLTGVLAAAMDHVLADPAQRPVAPPAGPPWEWEIEQASASRG